LGSAVGASDPEHPEELVELDGGLDRPTIGVEGIEDLGAL